MLNCQLIVHIKEKKSPKSYMQTTQFDLKCHDISPIGIMMACETMQDMVSCLAMSTSGGDNSTLLNLLQKISYIYNILYIYHIGNIYKFLDL